MTPRRSLLLASTLLLAAVCGCESTSRPRPALELDVARYIARVKQWADMERRVSAAMSTIFRDQFLHAEKITGITEALLPAIETHVNALDTYEPTTTEVAEIHGRYTHAWRRLLEGFRLIDAGMRADDGMRLAQGRRRLEVWQEQMQNVAAALRVLADGVGLGSTESAGPSRGPAPQALGKTARYRRAA
jgi:hypothetical protein